MLIDVNCWLGSWPFQRFAAGTAPALARRLQAEGIDLALVSPAEGILRPDPQDDNEALFRAVARTPALRPVPVLNPSLPGWPEQLRRWAARRIPAVRVLPNYHLYDLDGPAAAALAAALVELDLPLLVQLRVEDERSQHPLLRVAGVPVETVLAYAQRHPALRLACLCPYFGEAVALATGAANVWVDLAFAETLDTVVSLLARVPAERLLFGSHTPFLYPRAACAKLERAGLPPDAMEALRSGNARRLLGELLRR